MVLTAECAGELDWHSHTDLGEKESRIETIAIRAGRKGKKSERQT